MTTTINVDFNQVTRQILPSFKPFGIVNRCLPKISAPYEWPPKDYWQVEDGNARGDKYLTYFPNIGIKYNNYFYNKSTGNNKNSSNSRYCIYYTNENVNENNNILNTWVTGSNSARVAALENATFNATPTVSWDASLPVGNNTYRGEVFPLLDHYADNKFPIFFRYKGVPDAIDNWSLNGNAKYRWYRVLNDATKRARMIQHMGDWVEMMYKRYGKSQVDNWAFSWSNEIDCSSTYRVDPLVHMKFLYDAGTEIKTRSGTDDHDNPYTTNGCKFGGLEFLTNWNFLDALIQLWGTRNTSPHNTYNYFRNPNVNAPLTVDFLSYHTYFDFLTNVFTINLNNYSDRNTFMQSIMKELRYNPTYVSTCATCGNRLWMEGTKPTKFPAHKNPTTKINCPNTNITNPITYYNMSMYGAKEYMNNYYKTKYLSANGTYPTVYPEIWLGEHNMIGLYYGCKTDTILMDASFHAVWETLFKVTMAASSSPNISSTISTGVDAMFLWDMAASYGTLHLWSYDTTSKLFELNPLYHGLDFLYKYIRLSSMDRFCYVSSCGDSNLSYYALKQSCMPDGATPGYYIFMLWNKTSYDYGQNASDKQHWLGPDDIPNEIELKFVFDGNVTANTVYVQLYEQHDNLTRGWCESHESVNGTWDLDYASELNENGVPARMGYYADPRTYSTFGTTQKYTWVHMYPRPFSFTAFVLLPSKYNAIYSNPGVDQYTSYAWPTDHNEGAGTQMDQLKYLRARTPRYIIPYSTQYNTNVSRTLRTNGPMLIS